RAVVLDATFLGAASRDAAEAVARRAGVPFTGLWLTAPREILTKRVATRRGGASDATVEIVEQQLRRNVDPGAWRIIDAAGTAAETFRSATSVICADR
ncbi:MAG: AAA family ATPase, partial [Pseudomonadota bacterium]